MNSPFQCSTLVSAPCYPNAIAWSEENLIAVASGRLVTVLNPASVVGPRGMIGISPSTPLPIGVVGREDLSAACLMPITVSRDDNQPCARSLSWSHLGLAPNSGCLLAVCDTDGRVKLYRQPFCEYSSEWVEVANITNLLYEYHASTSFEKCNWPSLSCSDGTLIDKEGSKSREEILRMIPYEGKGGNPSDGELASASTIHTELAYVSVSTIKLGSSVEVLRVENSERVWMVGTIKSVEVSKALVALPGVNENGEQCEWFDLCLESTKMKDTTVNNGVLLSCAPVLPNIRPLTKLGCLPKEILSAMHLGLKKVLWTGQHVEAWIENRWFEGTFMRLNDRGLMVKLSGRTRGKTMDPSNVRLAPVWNGDSESWQITLLKIAPKSQELSGSALDEREIITEASLISPKEGKQLMKRKLFNKCYSITAEQYASRLAELSSLVVAWSPLLALSLESIICSQSSLSERCSVLAVGGKSGTISFWRVHEPQRYTTEHVTVSNDPVLIGCLQANNAWITAISWGMYALDSSNPQLILAMGSTNGSVKIWSVDAEKLRKSSEVSPYFSLLKEVRIPMPVSTISLVVPVKSIDKIQLAVGGGSGLIEVWFCCISSSQFQCIGSFDAHGQVVTGLSWASDGWCLYSSGLDNSLCCWVLCGTSLKKTSFPSSGHSGRSANGLPLIFDSCFGLALSPGNLVVALVHSCDVDVLDQMYQSRSQKAAVAYCWTGGQNMQIPLEKVCSHNNGSTLTVDVSSWECNIMKSLKQFEDIAKHLVLWDVIAALAALNVVAPDLVENLMFKWLMSLFEETCPNLSSNNILFEAPGLLIKTGTRLLHLLNIICRRLLTKVNSDGGEIWSQLLSASERELRERLVGFHFLAFLSCTSSSAKVLPLGRDWVPVGVGQMKQWVDSNHGSVSDRLVLLARDVATHGSRILSVCEKMPEEKCFFCGSEVPFESPEVAFCRGENCNINGSPCHKLNRCAVSMQVCSLTPPWFCVCCQRWVSNLAPWTFFMILESSLEYRLKTETNHIQDNSIPLCPFCGILLHRFLPEFLLSPSPV